MKKGFTLVEIMIVVAIIGLLAAIAIPSFMRARTTAQANGCINNLRQIDGAKDQYALEAGLSNFAVVTFADIGPTNTARGGYMKNWPNCPASTNYANTNKNATLTALDYTINVIGSNSLCIGLNAATPPHRTP
jgi:prepilin-type N-terminal cleavage/methylation domain-containing protein